MTLKVADEKKILEDSGTEEASDLPLILDFTAQQLAMSLSRVTRKPTGKTRVSNGFDIFGELPWGIRKKIREALPGIITNYEEQGFLLTAQERATLKEAAAENPSVSPKEGDISQ